jgi:uncharacterized protein YjbI with pentapeptide repeats
LRRQRLIDDLVIGLLVGLMVFLVSWNFESQAAIRQERLENLRFVRDRSSDDSNHPRPFRGMDLQEQNLSGLRLPSAQFVSANLNKADLRFVLLAGAELRSADLREAKLTQTTLAGAKFDDAKLNGAALDKAFARDASFKGADLEDANFTSTSLQGADFSGASNLGNADLTGICWNEATKWPQGFEPPPSSEPGTCP